MEPEGKLTVSKNPSKITSSSQTFYGEVRLHERISEDLKNNFHELLIESDKSNFMPDVLIRSGDRVVVVEVKTGDPGQPLPSSANVQMLILKESASRSLEGAEIVPVLVTNYKIDATDLKELTDGGIKVVPIQGSTYDSKALSSTLAEIMDSGSFLA